MENADIASLVEGSQHHANTGAWGCIDPAMPAQQKRQWMPKNY